MPNNTGLMLAAAALVCGGVMLGTGSIPAGAAEALPAGLSPGKWIVHPRDGSKSFPVCVRTGYELLQLRHRGLACRHRAIPAGGPHRIEMQYKCGQAGYGLTSLRREQAGLVQLSSQGFFNGTPFEFDAEARRVGACR